MGDAECNREFDDSVKGVDPEVDEFCRNKSSYDALLVCRKQGLTTAVDFCSLVHRVDTSNDLTRVFLSLSRVFSLGCFCCKPIQFCVK